MRSAAVGFHCPECTKNSSQKIYRPLAGSESVPRLTYALLAINIVVYMAQLATAGTADAVELQGWLYGPDVEAGEWWRILTSAFLHGSILHIGFNMYFVYIFGPNLEKALGWVKTLLIYLGGLFGASLAVLAFNFNAPTLGASGAALGLAGGLSAILWSRGVNIAQTGLGTLMGFNLIFPLIVGGISFWGHLGGIAGGAVIGAILAYGPGQLKLGERNTVLASVGVIVGLALGAYAVGLAGGVV